ncbi:MAG TPA: hypothetical protein VFY97_05685 [Rhodanobacteraceae bacterium]|nr:hypothetical protein [Rhodanobacteraceae bacterium]
MFAAFRPKAWRRLARSAALGAGSLILAGCATGYAFVQPDVAGGGGYYTSDGPYSGQGYYGYYGTGPYYPGTSGFGYYNGTNPYGGAFGWYSGYGYWSPFGFNLGISNIWNFPGYWGPWYTSGFPVRGCWYACHRHHRHDPDATASKPWLKPDHAPVPPGVASSPVPPVAVPARPMEGFATRRPLESAAFAPHDFARGPRSRASIPPRPVGMPARPVYTPSAPVTRAFSPRPAAPMRAPTAVPPGFSAPPRAVFRSAPPPPPRQTKRPANQTP